METRKIVAILVLALGLMLCQAKLCEAAPIGTAFTYQGYLYDANYPANDFYDLQFKLYDDLVGGSQVGTDVNMPDVDVVDGSFTIGLDFGSDVFSGDARWLEIAVRPGDSNDRYTTLSPRQEVTPTPYAIYAETAGVVTGFISGSGTANYIAQFTGPDAIANSVIYESAGNVGIGTTIPSEKLEVGGTVSATAFVGDGSGLTGITTTETDPTVLASVKDGISWSEVSSRPAGLDDGDDVGITAETDPTVPANLKDGVSWTEVANIPAGFADNVDNTGITSESDPTVPANLKDGVSWTEVANVPAGFADGIDNDSGGDITAVSASTGLSGGGTSGGVTLAFSTSWGDSRYVRLSASQTIGGTKTFSEQTHFDKGLTGDVGNRNAVVVYNNSSSYPTIWGKQYGSNYAGYFQGDLGCTGSKPATVETQSYGNRNLYADESAEIYFFDRGQGQLTNGLGVINLDPMFLETVTINDSYPMLVQITLTADCKGVFVAEKTSNSFSVQELQGGTSNATFDWEVAAKRKGYEDTRMEKITFVEESPVEAAGAITEPGEEGVAPPTRGVRIIKGE